MAPRVARSAAQMSRYGVHRPAAVDRPTGRGWVESPLQMLSAVECFHRGLLGDRADVTPRLGVPSLHGTMAALAGLGLADGFRLMPPASAPPVPPRHGTWTVGDAFSGQVQRRLLLTSAPRDVVLVDDGLATVHLLDLLTRRRPAPIVRARVKAGPARTALGMVVRPRLAGIARARRLTVFTAFAVDQALAVAASEVGVRLVSNDFRWLRAQPAPPAPEEALVVLGTSLVANDLVHATPYLAWVRALTRHGRVAYYPHRREDERTLGPLTDERTVTVHDSSVPAELRLRGLGRGQRLFSLPSTAVASLRVLLGGTGADVEALPVPDGWWTERAGRHLRSHLNLSAGDRVSASGRDSTYGLASAAVSHSLLASLPGARRA